METKDPSKSVQKSRAQKSKTVVEEKNLKRKFDSNNVCGITNDQIISMKQLQLGKKRVEMEERELFITSLDAETASKLNMPKKGRKKMSNL